MPLGQLHPYPANANVMSPARLDTLAHNIALQGRYPPLIVRPHPALSGRWQLLDGHSRLDVLRRLGYEEALCFVWPCDDATGLLLLATLNRLEGEDVPLKRAELFAELRELVPDEDLAAFLPEDDAAIRDTLALLDVDAEALLAELTRAAADGAEPGPADLLVRTAAGRRVDRRAGGGHCLPGDRREEPAWPGACRDLPRLHGGAA